VVGVIGTIANLGERGYWNSAGWFRPTGRPTSSLGA